ncbi:spore coat protein A [Hibiscus syriacus]|uniref:Spore coat protein A n=1 Tax=Hibiscus syriacus TaxID=106335 RepID=A0A6A3CMN9_HIBSY|nr:uncharacterized protein At1g66480-like [Hibiscus syriacus]KAE8730106.1 spore coat protein A [Hibiscus syriacus]
MGNSLGGKKMAKVMKINGETMKLKTPVTAEEVLRDYPGHVVLESEAVKHYGIRAKPLQSNQRLEPKRLYFLVVLPEAPKERVPRRVRSGINMSAKDRLESLMLSRRSVSDLTLLKPTISIPEGDEEEEGEGGGGATRVKMRLPKAEVEMLMKESASEEEAAEKIMQLCMGMTGRNSPRGEVAERRQVHWNGGREKRVSFMAMNGGGSQVAVSS